MNNNTGAAQWLREIALEVENNPKRWTKGRLAANANDCEVRPTDYHAVCWCAEGFMQRDNRTRIMNLFPGLVWDTNDALSLPSEFVQWFRSTAELLDNPVTQNA